MMNISANKLNMRSVFLIILALGIFREKDFGQQSGMPLPNAHAHNDYLHRHPLTDALDRGFTSVEADVFLRGHELYLGHLRPHRNKNRVRHPA